MTTHFWEFSLTGPLVEGMLIGLVFGLLALVGIWVAAELGGRAFHALKRGGGSHLDWKDFTKVFRHRHGTT